MTETPVAPAIIEAVRDFTRFYTAEVGLLDESLLESPFSLTEARVLYELAHNEGTSATNLVERLRLDAGYLSRVLARLDRQGLLARRRAADDGRRAELWLTAAGRAAFTALDSASISRWTHELAGLALADQERLLEALHTVRSLLGPRSAAVTLRTPRPGDMGWVIHRHGRLYALEYGWDQSFEALVAQIVAQFMEHFVPGREAAWLAELDGVVVGSVFLVRVDDEIAKLRLLYVEPSARGAGVGQRLVDECIRFARTAGYRKIVLWTNSVLTAARRLYQRNGFVLTGSEVHESFGTTLTGESWERSV